MLRPVAESETGNYSGIPLTCATTVGDSARNKWLMKYRTHRSGLSPVLVDRACHKVEARYLLHEVRGNADIV